MKKTKISPSSYIQTLPAEIRSDVVALDREVQKILKMPRTLWKGVFWGGSTQTIIGYGEYVYERPNGKGGSWFKVGLAVQKNYISIYVSAVKGKKYLVETYKRKLGKVKIGKSVMSFRSLADVHLPSLRALLREARGL